MPKFIPTLIPQGDPEAIRKQIAQEFNRIKEKIAQSDNRTNDMNLGGNRVTNVADPGAPLDAVNLRYLKKKLDDITMQHVQRRGLGKLYSVVFSNSAAVVAGSVGAAYTINTGQAGAPTLVSVLALGTGTSAASFNIARNGTNVLTSDIVLPASTVGPIVVTNFVPNTLFAIGDYLTPVVIKAGGASAVDLQIQILPNGA